MGSESFTAAEASECAADQDAFWKYHDHLFTNQKGENQGAFNVENLKQFAADLGLDTKQFNECLDSGKYTQAIRDQVSIAQSLGVSSTPTFAINGRGVQGALPYENFKQVIDTALAEDAP